MNQDQFDMFAFGGNMYAKTKSNTLKQFIISCDFRERLIGLLDEKPEGDFDAWDINWVRCESVTLIYLGDNLEPIFRESGK